MYFLLLVFFPNELCVRFVYLETFENEVILSSYDTKLSLEFHVGGVDVDLLIILTFKRDLSY